jgi:hypothetical protein
MPSRRFKILIALSAAWLVPWLGSVPTFGQEPPKTLQGLLPKGARVIETADLTELAGKSRMLVLWMQSPTKQDTGEEYCGTAVHGNFVWEGPTRLSLFDAKRGALINTVRILGRGSEGDDDATEDKFTLPALSPASDSYYKVPHPDAAGKGVPQILNLRDFTGNGIASEFALFQYDACGLVSTSVLGYQRASDRAIQYPIETRDRNGSAGAIRFWAQQVFAVQPVRPGYWQFTWGPGHGVDDVIDAKISFDRARQVFVDESVVR